MRNPVLYRLFMRFGLISVLDTHSPCNFIKNQPLAAGIRISQRAKRPKCFLRSRREFRSSPNEWVDRRDAWDGDLYQTSLVSIGFPFSFEEDDWYPFREHRGMRFFALVLCVLCIVNERARARHNPRPLACSAVTDRQIVWVSARYSRLYVATLKRAFVPRLRIECLSKKFSDVSHYTLIHSFIHS
jgi:hypothetical protein